MNVKMNAYFYLHLELLTLAEKRALGEALIASADSDASAPPLTEEQQEELRSRHAHHRANPDEPGITLAQLRVRLEPKQGNLMA
jgi:putative addiction module component (TIGR02574 family)